MFENKYDSTTNTKETEYVPVPETCEKKKGGFKKVIKGIGVLCLMGAISFGSVKGYQYYSNNSKDENLSVSKETSQAEEAASADSTGGDYEVESLLQLSKSEGSLTTQEVYEKVLPSVVGVTSTFTYTQQNSYGGFFGNSQGGSQSGEVSGTGTGIIMSADGYIITNAHVIYEAQYGGKASKVTVLLSDKTELEADIIGYDTQTDIAVLKAKDAKDLTAAEFGDSSALSVGDTALAIGNPLGFDLFGTLTVGYISGLNREIAMDDSVMHLIQTDAAINNGNSGGPLVNDKGQVIGINSMKLSNGYSTSSSSATIEGLGFAIPINEAREIVDDLMNNGYVTGRPQLGITCQNVTSTQNSSLSGVKILGVNENGAAEKAGLQVGDVIVGADGKQVGTISELNQVKNQFKAGDTLKITVIRENKYVDINVVLEEAVIETEESSEENSAENQQDSQNPEGAQQDEGQNEETPDPSQFGYGNGENGGNGGQYPYGGGSQDGGFPFPFSDFGFDFPF
ncbi:MAG: trypsin-like peptidase domain-containing protein [Oscillospiraceae bacterium]|nr:trypsin-like peptidase domain-containing protein [Oscillospiraceae bacterium]